MRMSPREIGLSVLKLALTTIILAVPYKIFEVAISPAELEHLKHLQEQLYESISQFDPFNLAWKLIVQAALVQLPMWLSALVSLRFLVGLPFAFIEIL
jgi:hypothetical protein